MTLSIPAEVEQALRSQAEQRRMSVEQLVSEAIASYLNSNATSGMSAPNSDPAVFFARELATYERHRAVLEREHLGKFALIRGDDLVGVFDRSEEASESGVHRFGLERFMVQEVGDPVIEMFIGIP